MRQKLIVVDGDGRTVFGIRSEDSGEVILGGKAGALMLAHGVVDDPNRKEKTSGGRFILRTCARTIGEIAERLKEHGFRVESVRAFRRLMH